MEFHRWLPPIPPEHGAKTILLVALVTPLSIGLGVHAPVAATVVPTYLPFVGIAAGSMLFREAVRQSLLEKPTARGRNGSIALLEAGGLVALVGWMVAMQELIWALLLLLPLGGAIEAWLTRDQRSNPLWKAGGGVLVIGALVPLGMVLLGVTDTVDLLAGYGLFFGYHLLAVLRVGTAVEALRGMSAIALVVPIAAFVLAVVGYGSSILGIGAPILFGVSGCRSGQLELQNETPSLKRLGQTEAMLSLAFVLAGPFLLS